MATKVRKWGNSLGVRIPKVLAEQAGIEVGTEVDLSVREGRLVVEPVRHEYRLPELLDRVTHRNRHAETDWGERVGREAW